MDWKKQILRNETEKSEAVLTLSIIAGTLQLLTMQSSEGQLALYRTIGDRTPQIRDNYTSTLNTVYLNPNQQDKVSLLPPA